MAMCRRNLFPGYHLRMCKELHSSYPKLRLASGFTITKSYKNGNSARRTALQRLHPAFHNPWTEVKQFQFGNIRKRTKNSNQSVSSGLSVRKNTSWIASTSAVIAVAMSNRYYR